MFRITFLFLFFNISFLSFSQDTLTQKQMDEVIIYSGKFAEKKKNVVQKIDVVTAPRIAQINAQNTGDLLMNTGNIFVQKSQQGGSSPIIRGFEASRVLLVVDGIRMNNAIYRSGHLQNVITVDQNMLERVEVLYGPASTLYGSDALGGVVHFRTKPPKFTITENTLFTGSAFTRYSSANNEKSVHADINIGGKKLAWLQSFNYSDFGDLKMGSTAPGKYAEFGRRRRYITSINGVDSIVQNRDDRVQKFSGYKQWDITQKILYKQNEKISHLLNFQFSNSSDVPRYDRLQDERNGTLRFAEWYYGPQLRKLAAYELNINNFIVFNDFRFITSYQHIKESRHQRLYRNTLRDNRFEDVKVWAATLDARKLWSNNELTVGLDGQWNDVTSTAHKLNISTGEKSRLDTRYPNGNNNMNYAGIYAQHILKMNDGKVVLNDGIRLQKNSLYSSIADNTIFNLPFTTIEQNNTAVTGNLGIIFIPNENLRFNTGFSTGFRAPNIDDLSKIFESNTASRQLIVPNQNIKPEYTYSIDAGITATIAKKLSIDISTYFTWFQNAIALAPFQLNGEDSIIYNGMMSKIFANQNINEARVYGFTFSSAYQIAKGIKASTTLNFTKGRLFPKNAAQIPLDHIPPVYGKTSVTFDFQRFNAEVFSLYNGWKRLEDYNPSGEDNAQYATSEGTPAWFTLNFRSTFKVHKFLSIQLGIENILDRNYRHFASGLSAAGRNFIFTLRTNF